MFLKKRKVSTDPQLRSLVQKAVRRGYAEVARDALLLLQRVGDDRWIRSRCVVLAAEECWPILGDLEIKSTPLERIKWILRIAEAEKYKDAAGLGTLAYVASEDDLSVLKGAESDQAIKIVAAGIKRPEDYWQWVIVEGESIGKGDYFRKLRSFTKWPTWPWDKAFVLASAFLSLKTAAQTVNCIEAASTGFPYWIAVDKHTDEGKQAIRVVAHRLRCTYRQLNWTSYYFESAIVNRLSESVWWENEKEWRLRKVGLSILEAEDLWRTARHLILEAVCDEAEALKVRIDQSGQRDSSLFA